MIKEKAYAKLNLTLNVIGKLDNGFHELKSIMVPVVDLFDELYFEENGTDEFKVIGCDILNNSIIKAAKAFQTKYKTTGANIHLVKRIPLEAGLAGGSADSSATLRGLNKLFGVNAPLKELEELAKELGSDNVFCLYNKAAICGGRGEKLEFINIPFSFEVTLVKPKFGLLTKEVFSQVILNKEVDLSNVLLALKNNDYLLLDKSIFNDLLIPATKVEPKLKEIISSLNENKVNCHMSGSGSCLYLLTDKELKTFDIESVYYAKHLVKNEVTD